MDTDEERFLHFFTIPVKMTQNISDVRVNSRSCVPFGGGQDTTVILLATHSFAMVRSVSDRETGILKPKASKGHRYHEL